MLDKFEFIRKIYNFGNYVVFPLVIVVRSRYEIRERERGENAAKNILAFRFIETKIAFVFSSVTPAFVTVPLGGERLWI